MVLYDRCMKWWCEWIDMLIIITLVKFKNDVKCVDYKVNKFKKK